MDFHSLKRKELQALCKKHKIPANLKNVDMAERLSALLKDENPTKRGSSCLKSDDCDEEIVGSKETKRVKFHSQNETFWFEKTDPREMRLMARKKRGFGKSVIEENPVSVVEDDVQNHSIVEEAFESKLRRKSVVVKCGQVSESKTVDDEVEKPIGKNLRSKSAVVKRDQISEPKAVDDEVEKPIGRNLRRKSAVVKCDQISDSKTVDDEVEKPVGSNLRKKSSVVECDQIWESKTADDKVEKPIGRSLRRKSALVKCDEISELNDKVEEPIERNLRKKAVVVKSDNVLDSKMGDDKVEKPNERASRRKSVVVKSDKISESKPMVDDEVEKPIERNRRQRSVVVKPDNDSDSEMVDDEGEKPVKRALRRKSVAVKLSKNSDSEIVNDKVERPVERASRRKSVFVNSNNESDSKINDDQVEIPIERASRRMSVVVKSSKKSDLVIVDDKAENTLKKSPDIAPDTKKGKRKRTTATVKKQEVKRGREAVAEDIMEENVGGELICHSIIEHSMPGSCAVGDVGGEQLSSSLGKIKSVMRDVETSERNEGHKNYTNEIVTLQQSLCEELPCLGSSPKNEDAEEDKRIDCAAVIVDGSDVQTSVQDEATGLWGHCDRFSKKVEQTCEFTIDQQSSHFASEEKVVSGPEADMETNVQAPVIVEGLTLSTNASASPETKVVEEGSNTYTVTPLRNQEIVSYCNDAEDSPVVQSLNKDYSTKNNASEYISLSDKPKYLEQSIVDAIGLQDHSDSMAREAEQICEFSVNEQPSHFASEEKIVLSPEANMETNVQTLGIVQTLPPDASASTGTKGIEEGSKTYTVTPLRNQEIVSCCNDAEDSPVVLSLNRDYSAVCSTKNNASECTSVSGKPKYSEQSVGNTAGLRDHCDNLAREVEQTCEFSVDQPPSHFVSEERVVLGPEAHLETNVQTLGNVKELTQSPNASASTETIGIEKDHKIYTTTPLRNQDIVSSCNNAEDSPVVKSLKKDDSIVGNSKNNASEGKTKCLEQNFVDATEDMEGNVSFSRNNNANLGNFEDSGKEEVSHPVIGVSHPDVRSTFFELSEHDPAEDTNTAANKLESDLKDVNKCAEWKSISEMDILNRLETLCDNYFAQSRELTVLSGSKLEESHIGRPSTDFTCFDTDEIGQCVVKNDQRLAVKQPEEANCFNEPELQHLVSGNDKDDITNNAQIMVLESKRVAGTTEDLLSLGGEVEKSDVLKKRKPADLASEGHSLHYAAYGSENKSGPTRDLELMTVRHDEDTDNDANNNHGEDNITKQVQVDEHAKSSNLKNATSCGGCLSSSTSVSENYLIKDTVDSVSELGANFNNDERFADLKSNSCIMAVELLENETPKVLHDQDSSHLSSQAKTILRVKIDSTSAGKVKEEVKSRAQETGYVEEAEGLGICGYESPDSTIQYRIDEAQSGQVLSQQTKSMVSIMKEFECFSEQAGSAEGAIAEAANSTVNESFKSYSEKEFGEEMESGLNVHSSFLVAVSKNSNSDGEDESVERSLLATDPGPSVGHGKDSDNSSSNTAEVYAARWEIASDSMQTLQENACNETLQNGEPISFEDGKDNKGNLMPKAELSHAVPPESAAPSNMISPAMVSDMHDESESITGQNSVNYASNKEMEVLCLTSIPFSAAEAKGDYEAEIAGPGDNDYLAMLESHSFGEIEKGTSVIVGGSEYAQEEQTQNHMDVANRFGQKNVNEEEDACMNINNGSATKRLEELSPCDIVEGSNVDTKFVHEETNSEAELEFNTNKSATPNNIISPALVSEMHDESESITGQNSVNYTSTREMEVLGLTSVPFSAAEAKGDYEAEIVGPGDNDYSAVVESHSFGEIEKGTSVIVGGSEYAQEEQTQNHMDVANRIGQKNVNEEEDACTNINDYSATAGLEELSTCDIVDGSDVDTIFVHEDTNTEAELEFNTNEGNCMSVEFTNQEHRGGHVDPIHADACMTEKDQAAVSVSGCLESSPCAIYDTDWAPKLIVHSESRSPAYNDCTQESDFAKNPDVWDPQENLGYSVEKETHINPFTSLSINTTSESLIATHGDFDGTSSQGFVNASDAHEMTQEFLSGSCSFAFHEQEKDIVCCKGNYSGPNSEDDKDDSAHLPCIGDSSEERVVDGSVGDITAIYNGIEEHFSKSERKIGETNDSGDNIADADSSSPFVPENTTDQHMDPTESACQPETNITALLDDADNECTQPNVFTYSEIDLFWGEWEAEKEESGKLPKEKLDVACPVDEFEIADVEYDTISTHKPAVEKILEDGNLASGEQEQLGNNEIEGRVDDELMMSSVIRRKNNISNSENEDFSDILFTDSEIELFWDKTEKEQIRELQAEPLDAMCPSDKENATADTHQSAVEKIMEPEILDSGEAKLSGIEEVSVSVAHVRDVKSGKGVKKSEDVNIDNKVLRSSMIQKENKRSILIHGTPKKLPQIMSDMKENTTAQKTRPMVDVTAAKPSLRKALKKIG